MSLRSSILILMAVCLPAVGADWYVSPSGTSSGGGLLATPWDTTTAFTNNLIAANSNHVVQAGDTIWLRGGTYTVGNYNVGISTNSIWYVYLSGATNNHVTIRGYPGERPIFDGGLYSQGDFITFWGFEIMCSNTNRYFGPGYFDERHGGLNFYGLCPRAINMVIHDVGQPGIYIPVTAHGPAEIYGCITYSCGDYDANGPAIRGNSMYLQHGTNGDWPIVVSDNFAWRDFTYGIKLLGSYQSTENGYFVGNIIVNNPQTGLQVQNQTPVSLYGSTNLTVVSNYFFANATGIMLGNDNVDGGGLPIISNNLATATGNYVVGQGTGITVYYWTNLTWSSNTIICANLTNNAPLGKFAFFWPDLANSSITCDWNTYRGGYYDYGGYLYTKTFGWSNTVGITFTDWQGHCGEANSTWATNVPTANVIIVRTNKYERGRAHIIVYNWHGDATADANISGLSLVAGQRFSVQDLQNYGVEIATGVYNPASPTVTLPLTLTNVAPLIGTLTNFTGFQLDPYAHTPSTFNAFLLLPESARIASATTLRVGTLRGP